MTAPVVTAGCESMVSAQRWVGWRYLLILLTGIAAFIGLDLADGQLHNGDPDDLLRALQVRRLLATGGWHDLSLPIIAMPEPYVSPWSRLVDLPYAAISLLLQPVIGQDRALEVAFLVWPPVMAGIYGLLAVAILRRLAPRCSELPVFMLLGVIILMTNAIWEFSPGRIDHHNVQMLLILCLVLGCCRRGRRGGLLAGAAAALSVVVGLETLALLAAGLLAIVCLWWFDLPGTGTMLRFTGIGCAATAVASMLLFIPVTGMLVGHADAFSAPFALALIGFGLAAAIAPSLLPSGQGRGLKIAATGITGAGLVALIVWQYPILIGGPLAIIHDLTRLYWFDRIAQEKSALIFAANGDLNAVALLATFGWIMAACLPAIAGAIRRSDPVLPTVYAIAGSALVVTLMSSRSLRLAAAVVPLLLPVALAGLAVGSRAFMARLAALCATVCVALLAVYPIQRLSPAKSAGPDVFDFLLLNSCAGQDFSGLGALPPGRIMTPPALGLEIVGRLPAGVTVSSIPFHRAAPGMRRLLQAAMAATAGDRRRALAGFDYLALCRAPTGLTGEQQVPMFAALMRGEAVAELQPLSAGRSGDLLLYRIIRERKPN